MNEMSFTINGTTTVSGHDNTTLTGRDVAPFDISSKLYIVILESMLAVFVCIGNALVLIAGIKYQHLRTATNMFLFNLAIADLSVGLITVPIRITFYCLSVSIIKRTAWLCHLKYFSTIIPLGASSWLLLMMSINRCISIFNPLKYRAMGTKIRTRTICGVVWFYTVTETVLTWYFWARPTVQKSCIRLNDVAWPFALLPIIKQTTVKLSLFFIYIAILVRANRSSKTAHRSSKTANSLESEKRQSSEHGENKQGYAETEINHNRCCCSLTIGNGRALRTVCTVVAVYTLCTTPLVLVLTAQLVYESRGEPKTDVIRLALSITSAIWILNSGINPIIYHARLPAFRKAFLALFHCKHDDFNINISST